MAHALVLREPMELARTFSPQHSEEGAVRHPHQRPAYQVHWRVVRARARLPPSSRAFFFFNGSPVRAQLTMDLLATYKRINTVYYEKRRFNDGYDDKHGDYILLAGDVLADRYEVGERLGSGSFGQGEQWTAAPACGVASHPRVHSCRMRGSPHGRQCGHQGACGDAEGEGA